MAERLALIRLQPRCVVDWGSFIGASHDVLARACPRARHIAVEPDARRKQATAAARARPWWSPQRWTAAELQVVCAHELGAGQGQLLWANMSLHGETDPLAVIRRWHAALEVDGFLMFTTLGAGTLAKLREVYADAGWPAALAPFVDMHDLGDMLVEAGFADPVMDQETLTLTWPTPAAALAELRQLGGNVDARRWPGLRTPRWRQRLCDALADRAGPGGRTGLDFEVVYGHAFKLAERPRRSDGAAVSLDEMRAMLRSPALAPAAAAGSLVRQGQAASARL